MSATYRITTRYPDCPTCEAAVDGVTHGSIDEVDSERYLDTTPSIHAQGVPFVLRPCGHEMYGCLIRDLGAADAEVTTWHETVEHADISHALSDR